MNSPVVFLDKDGTLVEDVPYNVEPDRVQLKPGAGEAVALLASAGWRIAIVTNQSAVARGLFPETALVEVEERIRDLLAPHGVQLSGFFYCPHHPDGTLPEYSIRCTCRKPEPGLLITGASVLGVDLRACWVIGDKLSDVQAGQRAGCHSILIMAGESDGDTPANSVRGFQASSLHEAATLILRSKR